MGKGFLPCAEVWDGWMDGWTEPAWPLPLRVFPRGVLVRLRLEAAAPNSESPSAQQGLLFQKGQPWV